MITANDLYELFLKENPKALFWGTYEIPRDKEAIESLLIEYYKVQDGTYPAVSEAIKTRLAFAFFKMYHTQAGGVDAAAFTTAEKMYNILEKQAKNLQDNASGAGGVKYTAIVTHRKKGMNY